MKNTSLKHDIQKQQQQAATILTHTRITQMHLPKTKTHQTLYTILKKMNHTKTPVKQHVNHVRPFEKNTHTHTINAHMPCNNNNTHTQHKPYNHNKTKRTNTPINTTHNTANKIRKSTVNHVNQFGKPPHTHMKHKNAPIHQDKHTVKHANPIGNTHDALKYVCPKQYIYILK